jgi:molecular chaperone GrpE
MKQKDKAAKQQEDTESQERVEEQLAQEEPDADDVEDSVEIDKAEETPVSEEENEPVKLKQELAALQDRFTRLAAEFDNYKKRTTREFANLIKSANEQLIIDLLEVLDNFDRAFASKEQGAELEAYDKGIRLVYNRLMDTLSRAGLKRFESVGERFDPNLHDAMLQVEDDDSEPDTIAQEFQPGYYLNDKVIRHAKVGVVKSKDEG